ncbi:S8 family peptidase [Roseovarius bejariae]|nr:S8 family peptidase [Roseovarius bejariae]
MNAAARYADGGTGLGSLIAVFDSGADVNHVDLAANIDDSLSHTYYEAPNNDISDVFDDSGHGTYMAHIIAGAKNDVGSHGVAFDADLMILQGIAHQGKRRVQLHGSLAHATRSAISAGAQAINHSWIFFDEEKRTRTIDRYSSRSHLEGFFGSDVMDAFDTAVENDLVMVFATGNDGLAQPSNTAGMAVLFPEMGNHVLGVTAIDRNDQIASSANRCGDARNFCLAAPGVGIYAAHADEQRNGIFSGTSGTSPAAAHVSGAVGVMASNFPELTGAEITTILRDTARDLGAAGVDSVYGHGALDLENAVMPQGEITLQTTSTLGEREIAASDSHVSAPGVMAAALSQSFGDTSVMVTDGYDRGYTASLGAFVGSGFDSARSLDRMDAFVQGHDSASQIRGNDTTLAFSMSSGAALPDDPYAGLFETAGSVSMAADLGATRVTVASAFAGRDSAMDGYYASLGAAHDFGGVMLETRFGLTRERDSFLGTQVSGAFGGIDSQTTFASLGGQIDIGAGAALSATATLGETSFDGSNLLRKGSGIGTQSIRLGYEARDIIAAYDSFAFAASREMSLTGGEMTVALPTALGAAEGSTRSSDVTVETQSIAMEQVSAPLDLEMRYTRQVGLGRFALGANWRPDVSGHEVVSVGYTVRF